MDCLHYQLRKVANMNSTTYRCIWCSELYDTIPYRQPVAVYGTLEERNAACDCIAQMETELSVKNEQILKLTTALADCGKEISDLRKPIDESMIEFGDPKAREGEK